MRDPSLRADPAAPGFLGTGGVPHGFGPFISSEFLEGHKREIGPQGLIGLKSDIGDIGPKGGPGPVGPKGDT